MHELIVVIFLLGADLSQALNLTGVNERGLYHFGLCAGKLSLRHLLLILLSLSNEEVVVIRIRKQVTTGLDGSIELAALEVIGGNGDLVHVLIGEYVDQIVFIVYNRVLIDKLTDLVAQVVNRE
jgi:hypothetical protein